MCFPTLSRVARLSNRRATLLRVTSVALSAVGVPRLDPAPERKGGGIQNAGGGRRLPLVAVRAGGVECQVVEAFLYSVLPLQKPEIAIRVLKTQSSCEEALAAEPSTGEWL